MKKTLISAFALISLFTSCEKDFSEENGENTDGITISNPTSGAAANACKACDYYPTCTGTVYNYVDKRGGMATSSTDGARSTTTLTYLSDTTIDGKVYRKVKNEADQVSFYNCTDGSMVQLYMNLNIQTLVTSPLVKVNPIRANDAVGSAWRTSTTASSTSTEVSDYTIEEKGLIKRIAGVTYNDVTHVRQFISSETNNVPARPHMYVESYYAKGIGLIESTSYNMYDNSILTNRILTSYIIP
jgi:hypothetical protein